MYKKPSYISYQPSAFSYYWAGNMIALTMDKVLLGQKISFFLLGLGSFHQSLIYMASSELS
jgi:hypothetical protein